MVKEEHSYVVDKIGRNIGQKYVLFSQERRIYVSNTGRGETLDRFWAWSGTAQQARNLAKEHPYAPDMVLYRNREEKE